MNRMKVQVLTLQAHAQPRRVRRTNQEITLILLTNMMILNLMLLRAQSELIRMRGVECVSNAARSVKTNTI